MGIVVSLMDKKQCKYSCVHRTENGGCLLFAFEQEMNTPFVFTKNDRAHRKLSQERR